MTQFKLKTKVEERRRKKSWADKVDLVKNSINRCKQSPAFIRLFFKNLFFLNPKLEEYFVETDWEKQDIAIRKAIDHIVGFLDHDPTSIHHQNIIRLAGTHSKHNLNVHPHLYYYWIDAMVMTMKELDHLWHKDLQFYVRECMFFPISFMISMYHKEP